MNKHADPVALSPFAAPHVAFGENCAVVLNRVPVVICPIDDHCVDLLTVSKPPPVVPNTGRQPHSRADIRQRSDSRPRNPSHAPPQPFIPVPASTSLTRLDRS